MVLQLLVNFVNEFRLELMYIYFIESIRLILTHIHDFQLLVLLSWFIQVTFFVCTNGLNLLNLK